MGACVGYLSSNVKRTFRPKNWRNMRKEYLKVPLDKISVNYDITDTEWLMTAMEDESKELLDNVNVNNHKTKDKKQTTSAKSKSSDSNSQSFFSRKIKQDSFESVSVSGSGSDYETEMNPQTKGKDSRQKSMNNRNRANEEVPLFWMSSDDEEDDEGQNELLFNGNGNIKSEYRELEMIGDSSKSHSQNCQAKNERKLEKEETFSVCLNDNAKKLEECCERGDAKTGQLIN